jgi:hypothetical protein
MNVGQIQRLQCYIEPHGSLGVDHTDTMGDFFDIPAIEGTVEFTINPNAIEKKLLRQNRDQYAGTLRALQTATLSFEIPFFLPTVRSVAGTSPVAIAATPTSKLLAAYLGGCNLGTSMDADSSCTTTLIKTADYANAAEGVGVAWADTTGKMFCREVVKVATTDLTLDQALPSAPVAADYIYRGIDLWLANRNTSSVSTFQFLLSGPEYDEDAWLMTGGQCTTAPSFTFKNGERPTCKFTFEFAKAVVKPALLTSLTNITYTNVKETLVTDGIFTAWAIDTSNPAVATAIKTGLAAQEISIDIGAAKYMKITSPAAGGVGAYIMVGDSPKAKGSFTIPWEEDDQTFYDLYVSKAPIAMCLQVGSSEADGCFMFKIGCAEISDWQIDRKAGLLNQVISWTAFLDPMHYTGIDTATELANSPFKIYMF